MGRKKVEEHTPKFTVKREGCHFRLVALREFWCHDKYIKRGEQGGLIDNELNLSQEGSCWITKDACVYGKARVYGDALITLSTCDYTQGAERFVIVAKRVK